MNDNNLISTKFIMASACLLMVFLAFMMNKLDGQTFMQVLLGILGIYTGGNVVAKFSPPPGQSNNN